MKYIYSTLLIFSFSFTYAQISLIGKKVPNFSFNHVLNDKDSSYSLSDFEGKAVMLDFWATHCFPCIEAFPKMEALQKEFPQDLKIITISNSDSDSRIHRFLEKHPTILPIVLDKNAEISKVFPHRSIPHTILIDKAGRVQAITKSDSIDSETIKKVIRGEPISIKEKRDIMDYDPDKQTLSSIAPILLGQITLTGYLQGLSSRSTRFHQGHMTFINLLPSTIYEVLLGFPNNSRKVWNIDEKKYEWNEQNLISIEIIAPDKTEQEAKQALIDYLHTHIKLKAKIEEREKPVKVLKFKNAHLKTLLIPEKYEYWGSGIEMENDKIAVLAQFIESKFQEPIVDETGLNGQYSFKLNYYNENPQAFYEDLDKIGLKLEDAKRTIKVLILYE